MEPHANSDGRRGRDPEIGGLGEATVPTDRDMEDPVLSDDDIFEVLYNDRRRRVLEYLRDGDGTATVGEVAEHVAAAENGTTVRELSSYERKRVYVSLYQSHFPMMDDANVIDYDDGRKRIQLLETVEALDPYLEGTHHQLRRGAVTAVGLLVAASVLFGGLQVGVFAAASTAVWTVFGIAGLVGITCYEMYNVFTDR
jgi:uncharacterized protein YqkB